MTDRSTGARASRPIAHCYVVASPEWGEVVPILDDGSGPMEYTCDVIYVFARNAKRARVLALRTFRRQFGFCDWMDGNPFKGMTAQRMDTSDNLREEDFA